MLIGYSGTGYKGMQISPSEKTIEGDLFDAFIAAGAISKANANDPKKAGLVRCARTDKGVHAAGNMISLKLIVEEEDIVAKINSKLNPQIRVWGIERTIGSFSCYQACDSRWYEYLIPSHAFLAPHPSSWLAKQLEKFADEMEDRDGYESRQAEVSGFWKEVDERDIQPILESIDEDIRFDVVKALQGVDEAFARFAVENLEHEKAGPSISSEAAKHLEADIPPTADHDATMSPTGTTEARVSADIGMTDSGDVMPSAETKNADVESVSAHGQDEMLHTTGNDDVDLSSLQPTPDDDRTLRLRAATKRLRHAYNEAKRLYRIPESRIHRIQAALEHYVGTLNYHNYTVAKTFKDPSAKRHIKSFIVNPQPILIRDPEDESTSEWLSLKVHGQSFMMHQIRKMVGMATLLVRCGSDLDTMPKSFGSDKYRIPKVPGLGLLLERPVFDSYNNLRAVKHGRDKLDFDKYEKELEAFKQREIYQRIFREEKARNEFSKFFNGVDNLKENWFLWVTSKGIEATWRAKEAGAAVEDSEEDRGRTRTR